MLGLFFWRMAVVVQDVSFRPMHAIRWRPNQVPLVCVNDNYPPEFFDDDGSLNFPDFLPPRSDFILQARNLSEAGNHSSWGALMPVTPHAQQCTVQYVERAGGR